MLLTLRLVKLLEEGKDKLIDVKGQVIYYGDQHQPNQEKPIGSAGPTTVIDRDAYALI